MEEMFNIKQIIPHASCELRNYSTRNNIGEKHFIFYL